MDALDDRVADDAYSSFDFVCELGAFAKGSE
jgi:hypothetical protein